MSNKRVYRITDRGQQLNGKYGITGRMIAKMTEEELAEHIKNTENKGFNVSYEVIA